MATATATGTGATTTTTANTNQAAQQQALEEEKFDLIKLLREFIERLLTGKPHFYKALDEVQKNLEECTYHNVMTTELMENLYNIVFEANGSMEKLTVPKAKETLDRINSEMEQALDKVKEIQPIDDILYADGKLDSTYGVFKKENEYYLAHKDSEGKITGVLGYKIKERVDPNDKSSKSLLVSEQVYIDQELDKFEEVKGIGDNDPVLEQLVGGDRIKGILAVSILGDEIGKGYAKQIHKKRELTREVSQLTNENEVYAAIQRGELETAEGDYISGLNDEGCFYIADLNEGKMITFYSQEGIDTAVLNNCTHQGAKIEDNKDREVATWRRGKALDGGETVEVAYAFDNKKVAYNMMQTPVVKRYLELRKLGDVDKQREDRKVDASKIKLTGKNNTKLNNYVKHLVSHLPEGYKVEHVDKYSMVDITTPTNTLFKIQFDKNGIPQTIKEVDLVNEKETKIGKIETTLAIRGREFGKNPEYYNVVRAFQSAAKVLDSDYYKTNLSQNMKDSFNQYKQSFNLPENDKSSYINKSAERNGLKERAQAVNAISNDPTQMLINNDKNEKVDKPLTAPDVEPPTPTNEPDIEYIPIVDPTPVANESRKDDINFDEIYNKIVAEPDKINDNQKEAAKAAIVKNVPTLSEDKQLAFIKSATPEFVIPLINAESEIIRAAVAKRGIGLDSLVIDPSDKVRTSVIDGLATISDKSIVGTYTKKLSEDKSDLVRGYLAKCGYELDTLKKDANYDVQKAAKDKLKELDKGKDDKVI